MIFCSTSPQSWAKNGQAYYENLWNTNCIGTRNVIEECVAKEIPLVFSSSSEAYGLSEQYNNGEATARRDAGQLPSAVP